MGLSNNIEKDPDLDVSLDIELRRKFYEEEILRYIQEGIFSARRIIRKLYDPDDPIFTKAVILEIIRNVQQQIKSEWDSRSVLDDVIAFLEQNEEMIIRANREVQRAERTRDRVTAINTVAGLWRDRISFLKDMGTRFDKELNGENGAHSQKQLESKRSKALSELHKEADIIEAEFEEVPESA